MAALPARTCKLAVTRKDGSPHVAPVWVDLDRGGGPEGEDQIVFMTSADTIKGKSILRDGRVALCFDDEAPPFSFVTISGTTTTSTDTDELLVWGTRIGGRYMGVEHAAGVWGTQRSDTRDGRARRRRPGSRPRSMSQAGSEAT